MQRVAIRGGGPYARIAGGATSGSRSTGGASSGSKGGVVGGGAAAGNVPSGTVGFKIDEDKRLSLEETGSLFSYITIILFEFFVVYSPYITNSIFRIIIIRRYNTDSYVNSRDFTVI